jgi:hypothetical protein
VELRDHHCGIASVEHRNPFHAPQFGFTQLYRKDTVQYSRARVVLSYVARESGYRFRRLHLLVSQVESCD